MVVKDADLKIIDKAISSIDKKYGNCSIYILDSNKRLQDIEVVPTGSSALNEALGVGGLPKGRIVELFGPEMSGKTTLALQIVSEAQKLNLSCAYIDVEHAVDTKYAKSIGVQADKLLISQPDCGEDALDMVEMLILSGIKIVVVDSVAALVPKAELEGDIGDQHMALQARLMSQALRRLISVVAKNGAICIFINQLRDKIGVSWGCVHGETIVNFADGRGIPIKKVVNEKIKGKVWSYNVLKKTFEQAIITNWYNNGNTDDWIHIESNGIQTKNGKFGFTVTPDHLVLTDKGYIKAKYLTVNDNLITKFDCLFNDNSLTEFILGTCIGDTYLSLRSKNTASLKIQDSINKDYMNWKVNKLKEFFKFKFDGVKYVSDYSFELANLKKLIKRRDPSSVINNPRFTWMSLALWIMDDGCLSVDKNGKRFRYIISIKRLSNNSTILNLIKKQLNNKFGITAYINIKNGSLCFNQASSEIISKNICKFVPDCMQYKLIPFYKNKYEDFKLKAVHVVTDFYSKIISIRQASKRQIRNTNKYDIGVSKNKNYLVGNVDNGVVIHNSNEVTPGGKALKFYASIRIDIRKIKQIKVGENIIGNRVKAKVVKNKVAVPFKEAEFNIIFGKGIDYITEIVDTAISKGVIIQSGAWFSYGSERLGQGKEAVKVLLNNNPTLLNEIIEKTNLSNNEITNIIEEGENLAEGKFEFRS